MKLKFFALSFCLCLISCYKVNAHDIIFCGERIPVDNNFVSNTLMNVVRRQIPNINMPQLRKRINLYFPWIEQYLRGSGLPEDLKYLAVVESGFQNETSTAGAKGFWQIMPATAQDMGLNITPGADDRENFYKSTEAACRILATCYLQIHKKYNISSWVLTAAAYNTGIGNMLNAIGRQGKDYFSMKLNPETAMYVYKIIAVKELFEYPELYMKDFGYNVFATSKPAIPLNNQNIANTDLSVFNSITVNVNTVDGQHPDSVSSENQLVNNTSKLNVAYIPANIKGKYKTFTDGQLVAIQLQENLTVNGIFNRKGNVIKGTGWVIDNRILIDLGYADHAVTIINNGKKGIDVSQLKNDQPILLRVQTDDTLN